MQVPVKQFLHLFPHGRNMFSLLFHGFQFVCLLQGAPGCKKRSQQNPQGYNAIKKNDQGTVPIHILIDAFGLVPYLLLFHIAQGNQFFQVIDAPLEQVEQDSPFQHQKKHPFYHLSPGQAADAKKHRGKPGKP